MTFLALNDAVVPAAEAALPVTAEGLRYGSGCFETIAWEGGAPRFWARHMERFTRSCARLGLEPRVQPARLRALLGELAQRNQSAGQGVVRVSAHQNGQAGDIVLTLAPPRHTGERQPMSAVAASAPHPGVWALSGIKHNNYARFAAAAQEAQVAGFDEALLANGQGHLLEGSRTNLFLVCRAGGGWQIRTAPLSSGVLPGVMRAVTLELAAQLGFAMYETVFTAEELARADGCFVTNALIGMVPLARFGNHSFGAAQVAVAASGAHSDASAYGVADALHRAMLDLAAREREQGR